QVGEADPRDQHGRRVADHGLRRLRGHRRPRDDRARDQRRDSAADRVTSSEATASQPTGAVVGWPRNWLRLEGLAGLAAGVIGYRAAGGDLLWLVPALLAVDVSMVGYLAGSHPGAIVY